MMIFEILILVGFIYLWRRQSRLHQSLLSQVTELEKVISTLKTQFQVSGVKPETNGEKSETKTSKEKEAGEKVKPTRKPSPMPPDSLADMASVKPQTPLTTPMPPDSKPTSRESQFRRRWKQFVDNVDWELFTGVKLFAWMGGLALFIGAGFFVKYSIDRNLIPPTARLAIGAVVGIGLILWTFRFDRNRYETLRQTLVAGGIGILYMVVFAATIYYEYLTKPIGFAMLCLISGTAFVMAVYHRGIAISILGALGAYATPVLVSTAQGGLGQLFIYLVIVNLGLFEVMRRLNSGFLLLFAVSGTLATLFLGTFAGTAFISNNLISIVWIANLLLFTVFIDWMTSRKAVSQSRSWSWNFLFWGVLATAALLLLKKPSNASLLIATAAMIGANILSFRNQYWYNRCLVYFIFTFAIAMGWVGLAFDPRDISTQFVIFLLYGVAGGIGPVALIQQYGLDKKNQRWLKVFPLAVVVLGMAVLLKWPMVNFWFWPMILALQMFGILVSLLIGAMIQVGLLTVVIMAGGIYWVTQAPTSAMDSGFFVFLLVTGVLMLSITYLALRYLPRWLSDLGSNLHPTTDSLKPAFNLAEWMKAAPVLGAFVLLGVTFLLQRPLHPHPGMATLACFTGIAVFLAKRISFSPLAVTALLACALAESAWMMFPFPDGEFSALIWSLGGFTCAMILPFIVFRPATQWDRVWMAWSVFELFQAVFMFQATDLLWGRQISGCLPAAMAIVKLPGIYYLLKQLEGKNSRNAVLGFHGGVLLLYVSSLPVIWFEKGWLGVTIVFESAALLWLNQRIIHPGLRWVSVVTAPVGLFLLMTNFANMINTESLPVFNEAILATALCLPALAIAQNMADFPDRKLRFMDLPNYFLWLSLGTGFFLLNLTIADLFGESGLTSSTFFQTETPFHLFLGDTLTMATVSSAGWTGFGLVLVHWPKKLSPPFRITGMVMILAGLIMTGILPLRFAKAFGQLPPLLNIQTLLFLFSIAGSGFMVYKKNLPGWPLSRISFRSAWFLVTGIFTFWVLNVEIASVFGDNRYGFSLMTHGNFSHQLAYSLGWLCFAIGLLIIGIRFRHIATRWTALVMMVITAIKIFLKDLWSLGQLYRVGSLIGLAVVLMMVSFLYQRYLAKGNTNEK